MISITLYKNTSPKNKIGKSLTNGLTLTGQANGEMDVHNPSFLVETTENISDYNYCSVDYLGRKYFIEKIVAVRTNIWRIMCRVDVLDSYKDEILANDAVIERQENEWNLYLNDPEWQIQGNAQVLTREFPSGFQNTGNYYLTMMGGYSDQE